MINRNKPVQNITEEDRKNIKYGKLLSKSLKVFFGDALKISLKNPSQAYFFSKTLWWQRQAVRIRQNWENQGIHVPPIMVFSITNRCNLHCKGCYNQNF